jgi:transposase
VRLEVENDLETVRRAALILEAENKKLVEKNLELTRKLLELQGAGSEQLQLKLAELARQLQTRNRQLFGQLNEKRSKGKSHKQRQPQQGHGPKPQDLQQMDLIVPLPFETGQGATPQCEHCGKSVIEWEGQFEESEEIDCIERQFVIKKIKRKKAHCECHRTIVTAPAPLKLFPGARYAIGFAVMVVVAKYADHLPLERQVKMMNRDGLDVDSQTLWDYVWAVAQLLKPAHQRLLEYLLSKPVIGADETWWRMMAGKGKRAGGDGKDWWVWSACSDDAVYYRLADSRSTNAAKQILGEYSGIVMCDGFSAYSSLSKQPGTHFTLAHCWAHVRRKFFDIESQEPRAKEALDYIDELFTVEALCPTGPPGDESRARVRAERSRSTIKQLQRWALSVDALPQSPLRRAVQYMGNMWSGLVRFLDDPRIPLSNNHTERSLRGPVVGRKNFYGVRSKRGAEAAAILYSLLESAKLAGLDARVYLNSAIVAALEGKPIPLPHETAASV